MICVNWPSTNEGKLARVCYRLDELTGKVESQAGSDSRSVIKQTGDVDQERQKVV